MHLKNTAVLDINESVKTWLLAVAVKYTTEEALDGLNPEDGTDV